MFFGHKKGAFTGALQDKIGLLEAADEGSIFLDEIGETSPALQVRLLRVLENQTIRRVGEHADRKINVRIVAATNRDLKKEVLDGRFREDLYYRLNVFPIHIPALRERREDIPLLVHHFVRKFATELNKTIQDIDPRFIQILSNRAWKGNIRELKNTVQRSVFCSGTKLTADHLSDESSDDLVSDVPANPGMPIKTLEDMQRTYIAGVIERCGGNKAEAAHKLGLKKTTLHMKMVKLGNLHRFHDLISFWLTCPINETNRLLSVLTNDHFEQDAVLVFAVSLFVVTIEYLIGFCLLLPVVWSIAIRLATLLFFLFLTINSLNLSSASTEACYCFGDALDTTRTFSLSLDLTLIIMTLAVIRINSHRRSTPS